MKKCIIITSYLEGDLNKLTDGFSADLIICADGGYNHAKSAGIKPDLLIGDLDSITDTRYPEIETLIFPAEKDDTDTGICLQTAINKGYEDILIIGGLGGRFDHTMSNIQLISGKSHMAKRIRIKDKGNTCMVLNASALSPAKVTIPSEENSYISLFSMSPECKGVTTYGLKYALKDATLKSGSTLGTSNEFTEESASISITDGILLIILSDR